MSDIVPRVLQFAHVLRGAGLPVGSDRVLAALQALQVAGLASAAELRTVLGACLLDRHEHRPLFDQAFDLVWRSPGPLDGATQVLPLAAAPDTGPEATPLSPRLAEAWQLLAAQPAPGSHDPDDGTPDLPDAALSWSAREQLQQTDFARMTAQEWRQAQRLAAQLRLRVAPLPTRRWRRAPPPGRADWRATLAAMGRHGGEAWDLRWRRPRRRPPPLVLLADISGSMGRYTRMLLHFGHALAHSGARVESFVFGTRLTRITRLLAGRDPDLALAQVAQAVPDWGGGTRISASLQAFNQGWARRVLGGGATVLLFSDGLEAGDSAALGFEMERLHKSCRRLVWLNPLLRYAQFEARAAGMRAMRPHVDHFLPAHNLASLAQLAVLLAEPAACAPGLSSRR